MAVIGRVDVADATKCTGDPEEDDGVGEVRVRPAQETEARENRAIARRSAIFITGTTPYECEADMKNQAVPSDKFLTKLDRSMGGIIIASNQNAKKVITSDQLARSVVGRTKGYHVIGSRAQWSKMHWLRGRKQISPQRTRSAQRKTGKSAADLRRWAQIKLFGNISFAENQKMNFGLLPKMFYLRTSA